MRTVPYLAVLFASIALCGRAAAEDASRAGRIHIVATIDGSDELHISTRSTKWVHKGWDFPASIQVNGRPWDAQQKPMLTPGLMGLLQRKDIDLSGAELHTIRGRGSVQLGHDTDGLVITFDDPQGGSDVYEITVDFAQLLAARKPEMTNKVRLRLQAIVDGTDEIWISQNGARWNHLEWQLPTGVTFGEAAWDVAKNPDFALRPALAPGFDLQKATLAKSAGRGWTHLEYRPQGFRPEALCLDFEDHAPGADKYEAVIDVPAFGQRHLVQIKADAGDALTGAALNIYRVPEADEARALVSGQRAFDEHGRCLAALESGRYQFEVQRQSDSQIVALKTEPIDINGPTNINLQAMLVEPELYGPQDQKMVLDDLLVRSTRPTGAVSWKISSNSKATSLRLLLSRNQTYKIHAFGHAQSNYIAIWKTVTAAEMKHISLAPDQLMSCSFGWRDGTPAASQKGIAFQFPDGDFEIPQPETARHFSNRRFFNLSYWLAFADDHKARFLPRGYLFLSAKDHKLMLGGPLRALASAAVLPDEGLNPPTAQHLWWDITLADPQNLLLDTAASKLDWKPAISMTDGEPAKIAPLLPDDVKRLGNLKDTLVASTAYWTVGPRNVSLAPARFVERRSSRFVTETPPYYDWNTRAYLSKAERELDFIGAMGNVPLPADLHMRINWWFNSGGVGGGFSVRMPFDSLIHGSDWYTHPWGIAHEMMHNFGYSHGHEMDRMDRGAQEYMEQFRYKVADHPDYVPEDSAELIKVN